MLRTIHNGMSLLLVISITPLLLIAGCSQRAHNVELLEAQLRDQEQRIWQLQSQMEERDKELELAKREKKILRQQVQHVGHSQLYPEQSRALAKTEGITLNKLFTGGLDEDGRPGDEKLTVNLSPHDTDGDLVKIAGTVEIEVLDLSLSGEQQRVGYWKFTPEETAAKWHSGFVSSGFLFKLPWQQRPQSDELTIHARFLSTDGRQFDTSLVVNVDLPANIHFDDSREKFARVPSRNERSRLQQMGGEPFSIGNGENNGQPKNQFNNETGDEQLILPAPPASVADSRATENRTPSRWTPPEPVEQFLPERTTTMKPVRPTGFASESFSTEQQPPERKQTRDIPIDIRTGLPYPGSFTGSSLPDDFIHDDDGPLNSDEMNVPNFDQSSRISSQDERENSGSRSLLRPEEFPGGVQVPGMAPPASAPKSPFIRESASEPDFELKIQSMQEMKTKRKPFDE